MKQLNIRWIGILALTVISLVSYSQPKGHLFIIGGGERTPELLEELVKTAGLDSRGYIVILPMATSVPEESVASISDQLSRYCNNPIANFNFNKEQANNAAAWIDSVQNARLIYITGGDQNRFMDVVRGTKLYDAIHHAYEKGATISGTSAGAAVMSEIMITGQEADTADKGNFRKIATGNVETAQGMGFVTTAVIDQHFIRRSRYNRLMSVLADHPDKMVIGIDESTAIIVSGRDAKVVGESQVVVISNPQDIKNLSNDKIRFKNAKLSLFMSGDTFTIKN